MLKKIHLTILLIIFSSCNNIDILSKGPNLATWKNTQSFINNRRYHASRCYKDNIYLVGGDEGGNGYNDIQIASINSNGSIFSWQTSSITLSDYLRNHTIEIYNGYLYIIAGYKGNSSPVITSDVFYAKINNNGSLGPLQAAPSLLTARSSHSSVVYKGYIYVSGGYSTVYENSIEFAKINSDGSLGNWENLTAFNIARENHSSLAYKDYLYIIGGDEGSFRNSTIQYAKINADGTIGTWNIDSDNLGWASYGHTNVIYNNFLYTIGGRDSSQYDQLQGAVVNADGSVGSFSFVSSFSTARSFHSSALCNGYLYLIGGTDGTNTLSDVQYTYFE